MDLTHSYSEDINASHGRFVYIFEERKMMFEIPFGISRIGRDPETSDLLLQDPTISASHCSIFASNEDTFVKDCHSKNGTSVNKRRLKNNEKVKLFHNDVLQLGQYRLRFFVKDSTTSLMPQEQPEVIVSLPTDQTRQTGHEAASDFPTQEETSPTPSSRWQPFFKCSAFVLGSVLVVAFIMITLIGQYNAPQDGKSFYKVLDTSLGKTLQLLWEKSLEEIVASVFSLLLRQIDVALWIDRLASAAGVTAANVAEIRRYFEVINEVRDVVLDPTYTDSTGSGERFMQDLNLPGWRPNT